MANAIRAAERIHTEIVRQEPIVRHLCPPKHLSASFVVSVSKRMMFGKSERFVRQAYVVIEATLSRMLMDIERNESRTFVPSLWLGWGDFLDWYWWFALRTHRET